MLVKTAGVKHLVILINKMDDPTVKWEQKRYDYCKDQLTPYLKVLLQFTLIYRVLLQFTLIYKVLLQFSLIYRVFFFYWPP